MTTTLTNSDHDEFAQAVNALAAENPNTTIDGHRLFTRWGPPATGWGTGSVSVRVYPKRGTTYRDLWFKPEETATLESGE